MDKEEAKAALQSTLTAMLESVESGDMTEADLRELCEFLEDWIKENCPEDPTA